jgi:hypothetical protein
LLDCSLHRGEIVLHAGVVRVKLEARFVCIGCADQVTLAVERCPLSSPSLWPIWLQLCGLLGILEGILPFLLRSIGSRSVAVEDVILGLDGDGFGKLLTRVGLSAHTLLAIQIIAA